MLCGTAYIEQAAVTAVTPYAAQFSGSNYLSVASNSALQTGNVDFSLDFWVWMTSGTSAGLVSREDTGSSREFRVAIEASRIRFLTFQASGSTAGGVYGSASALDASYYFNRWMRIRAWRNVAVAPATAATLSLQLDNEPVNTANENSPMAASPAAFQIGRLQYSSYFTGKIGSVSFSKNGVLVAKYEFQDASNLGLDSVGTNNLTNNGNVTQTPGYTP